LRFWELAVILKAYAAEKENEQLHRLMIAERGVYIAIGSDKP
jgi:hypothetical protein